MKARLVGNHGVATMHLVGGPLDGETKLAVVGAPIIVRIKPPAQKPKPASSGMYSIMLSTYASATEGDDWKKYAEANRKKREGRKYALYLPDVVDGKATGILRFGGEFIHTEAQQ